MAEKLPALKAAGGAYPSADGRSVACVRFTECSPARRLNGQTMMRRCNHQIDEARRLAQTLGVLRVPNPSAEGFNSERGATLRVVI